MSEKPYRLGVTVGRFQTFHSGHEYMLQKAIDLCDTVGVFVGSSQESGTLKNPFSYETRENMLKTVFGDKIRVYPLPDIGVGNNTKWGEYVLKNILDRFGSYPDLLVSGKEERRLNWFDGESGFEFFYKVVGNVRSEQAGHIFNADGVATHFLKFFCKLNKFFVRVNRADRVDKATLNFRFLRTFERGFNRNFEIANVVKRVKNSEYPDSVLGCVLHKFFDNVIGIMIVTEKILSAQKHLNGSFQFRFQLVETLPGIFVQKAKASIKSCAAPCFKSFVTDFVKTFEHRLHVAIAHTSCTK